MNNPEFVFAKNFWDKKILPWDIARYSKEASTISARHNEAIKLISPHLNGKVLLEYGCGTGRTIGPLFASGLKNYIGIDISSVAIERANQEARRLGVENMCQFYQADINTHQFPQADLVISLGLWDWISDHQVSLIFTKNPNALHLHSFSLLMNSWEEAFHRIFVYLQYGYKKTSYLPRYQSWQEVTALFSSIGPCTFHRTSGMSFGTIAHNLSTP